jgi:hypothetical protein
MARGAVSGQGGQAPGQRPAGTGGQAGAGQAAEAELRQRRRPHALIVEADPRQPRSASPPYTPQMAGEQIRRTAGMRLPAVSVRRPPRQARQAGPATAARRLAGKLPAIRAYLRPKLIRSPPSARLSTRGKRIVNPRSRSRPAACPRQHLRHPRSSLCPSTIPTSGTVTVFGWGRPSTRAPRTPPLGPRPQRDGQPRLKPRVSRPASACTRQRTQLGNRMSPPPRQLDRAQADALCASVTVLYELPSGAHSGGTARALRPSWVTFPLPLRPVACEGSPFSHQAQGSKGLGGHD